MTWTAVWLPVAVGIAVVLVPGLVIAAAANLRGVAALGLAGPLGYATIGLTGVVAAAVHVPFGLLPVAVCAAALAVIALLLRLGARAVGRPLPAWDSWRPTAWLPVLLAAAAASAVVWGVAYAHVDSPDRISQTYDAVFHLNAATHILQSGDASSLHLYRLTHVGKDIAYYPAVWHSITALIAGTTGVGIPAAANATWMSTAGPVFALSCAFASAVLFGGAGLRREAAAPVQRVLVATAGALAASMFVAFPYLLLDFGTLYPNGLAYTILPVGMALVAAVLPWPARSAWLPETPSPRWRTAVLLLGWFVAAGFSHPRSVVAILVLATPIVVAWFAARMSAVAATGETGRRRARLGWLLVVVGAVVLVAAAVAFVFHYYDVANEPIADRLTGGPARARETFANALLQGLLATSLVSPSQAALPPSILLAVVAFAGLIAAAFRPGLRWVPVTYLAIVLLYAFAAGSDSDLAKIATGLWDKDKFRILAMLPSIGVPLVAWTICAGTAELLATLRRRTHRDRSVPLVAGVTVAVALVVGAVTWTGPALGGVSAAIGTVFALPESSKDGRLLDAQETALLSDVGRFVPKGQLIAGNPWNGSAMAWTLGGRQVLFPHLGGYFGTDANRIKRHLDDYRTDPKVCPAVRRLDVRWVITDSGLMRGDKKAARAFQSISRVVKEPGAAELVASSGSAKLWRLTACWS
ncbi:DUF6541 family protein [Amnibacterium endophyticum]|uniref:DUF6541 family protein n=1 Tax=Amnibacterium endophyticum TaxID=2109337 RepID=A0ABW4LBF1_9MICO